MGRLTLHGYADGQQVFEGRHLRLHLTDGAPDRLFVSFDNYEPNKRGFRQAAGRRFFAERGWANLHVQTAANDWFLNPDLPAAIAAAAACGARYGVVVTYGFSMGGYGALRFAAGIGASRAVAISPQASPDPARTGFETRWRQARKGLDFRQDVLGDLAHCQVIAAFDPRHRQDAGHMRLLHSLVPGLNLLPLPFGGHPATRVIREGRRLGDFAEHLLVQGFDRAALLAYHKQSRRKSQHYAARLASLRNSCISSASALR